MLDVISQETESISHMTDNPYKPPSTGADGRAVLDQSSKSLWLAYAFAPAVAPITFVVTLFLLGAIATVFNIEVNPASFLVLPVLALTVGIVVCYVVAGAIGMPIAFYLRKRNALTGYTIHGAALCSAVFFSVVAGIPMSLANGDRLYVGIFILACFTIPFVLLSATCFWLIVRRNGGLTKTIAK